MGHSSIFLEGSAEGDLPALDSTPSMRRSQDGVHQAKPDESYTGDELKGFKREDAGYLSYKLATEKKAACTRRAAPWAAPSPRREMLNCQPR